MKGKPMAQVRRERLLSQRDFAELVAITSCTVYKIETGRSVPNLMTMRKICHALNVEPWEIAEFAAALGLEDEA